MPEQNCLLCNIIDDKYRLVYENQYALSVVIFNPVNSTHQMILPKRHVTALDDMSLEESKDIFALQYKVQQRLFQLYEEHPPIIAIQTGRHATQPHIHWQAFSSDAHIRSLYAKAHEISYNYIGSKEIGDRTDNRTHPKIPGTEKENPRAKENLENILGTIAIALRGTGNIDDDRKVLREITHHILSI